MANASSDPDPARAAAPPSKPRVNPAGIVKSLQQIQVSSVLMIVCGALLGCFVLVEGIKSRRDAVTCCFALLILVLGLANSTGAALLQSSLTTAGVLAAKRD